MQVLDRRGLEAHSCECYGVVRQAYARLSSGASAWPQASGHPLRPFDGAPTREALAPTNRHIA
jgi:hypothetical protein